jgi:hypothetical protein
LELFTIIFIAKILFRRSNGYITFTTDQVHLLPGFPIQLSDSSNTDGMIAAVAFYVKFPPGVAIGVTDTLDKSLLVDIVNASLTRIGRAINKTLLSVSVYMVDKRPNNSTSTDVPTTTEVTPTNVKNWYIIIGGSVAGIVVIAIITIAVVLILR